jgi:hypothetical protein
MRNILNNNIKNIFGWKSKRKLLAFAVDDYGNIRLSGLKAFENLNAYGLNLAGRFNKFDALDTKKDYDMLFDVLSSFKDIHNNPAIFTTYALPVNVDFKLTLGQSTYIPMLVCLRKIPITLKGLLNFCIKESKISFYDHNFMGENI